MGPPLAVIAGVMDLAFAPEDMDAKTTPVNTKHLKIKEMS